MLILLVDHQVTDLRTNKLFETWTISVGNSFWVILNLSGVFRGSVCGGEGLGKINSRLKLEHLVENFLVEK